MTSSATELLADAHATELRDEAPIARLAARARCGTPTACCTPA